MKPLFHTSSRPVAVLGRRPANRSTDFAPGAWVTSFTPWHPAPFLRVPPVAEVAGRELRGAGHATAPVRRGDLLLQAERLRTLGR